MSYYQTIYDSLRQAGLTKAGALGLLGNWDCESNCEPNRVQGDFSAGRILSRRYTEEVDSGVRSGEDFRRDGKGYGLAQWTYPTRKAALYDFARMSGKSIGDTELQVKFALKELAGEYTGLLGFLKATDDVQQACDRVCREYERPAVNNVEARYQAARRISRGLTEGTAQKPAVKEKAKPKETQEGSAPAWATMPVWAPGILSTGSIGAEVRLLQDILTCRDYYCTPDGIFGKNTKEKLKQFQADAGIEATGICDRDTWDALKW